MSLEQFEEAVALYAVDALDSEERRTLEVHVRAGCQECRAALKDYQATAGLLPYALPAQAVPFELQTHLTRTFQLDFAQARTSDDLPDSQPEQKGKLRSFLDGWWLLFRQPAVALVSVLLLVAIGAYAMTLRSQLETEASQRRQLEMAMQTESARLAALQAQTAEQEQKLNAIRNELADTLGSTRDTLQAREAEVAELRATLAEQEESRGQNKGLRRADEMAAFLRGSNIKAVSLTGSDEAKSAGGLLLFDPSTKRAFLYAFNMPSLPPGKTYQLWAILDKPVSAGTFGTDPGNKSRVLIRQIPELSRIKKFAVSLEPEGGQPQPTGQIYLSGQL